MINKEQAEINKLIQKSDKLFEQDNYIDAIEVLRSALSKDPANMETNYRLGIILNKIEKYKDAIKHFDIILSENDYKFIHHSHVLTLKGYAQSKIKDLKGAKESLTKALLYDGNNTKILAILSYIHYVAKEFDISMRIYDRILAIDENNVTALNSKGFILIETEKNIDKGLKLCKKAYEINPNFPAVLDSIGWAYYKKGEIETCLTYLKRAYELLPQNKEIKYHLKTAVDNAE